jgi:hypothetical protein
MAWALMPSSLIEEGFRTIHGRFLAHRPHFDRRDRDWLLADLREKERADPGVRDNAREETVIRMAPLRSTSPVFQKGSSHARPRVSHL